MGVWKAKKEQEEEGGRDGKKRGWITFLDLSLLHLVADLLLQVALVVVGEFGEVEVRLGEGGGVHVFLSVWALVLDEGRF